MRSTAASTAGQGSPAPRPHNKIQMQKFDNAIRKKTTYLSLWMSIPIMPLVFRSAAPPAGKGSPADYQNFKKTSWVTILGLFGTLISTVPLDMRFAGQGPTASHRHPKTAVYHYIIGVDFGVIWAADFDNATSYKVHRPTRRPKVTCRPPTRENDKKTTDISLLVSILSYFGPLILIIPLNMRSVAPPAGQKLHAVTPF